MDPQQTCRLTKQLGQVKHFSGLSEDELTQIILSGKTQCFARDEVIFVEGDSSQGLFVLLSGRVQFCKLSPQGQIAILSVFDPVMMFNEVSALDGQTCPATAIALSDSTVWRMDPEHLEDLVLRYPRVGIGMIRVLAARNRLLISQFEDLSFRSVLARAAKLLLELSAGGSCLVDRGKFPNHQLAARIATVPEAFSRSLKVFKENKDIFCTGQHIQVANPAHLKVIAQIGPHP